MEPRDDAINIQLDEQELEVLYEVLNAGIKVLGMTHVPFLSHFMTKVAEASKP